MGRRMLRCLCGALALFAECEAFSAPLTGFRQSGRPILNLQRKRSLHVNGVRALVSQQQAVSLPREQVAEAQWGKDAGEHVAGWRRNLDLAAWANEVREVERKYRQGQGEEDVVHLNKILNVSYLLYAVGLLTAGFAALPWNPISAICLSTSICARWTMVGHHVSHGGYNAQVGQHDRFHRSSYCCFTAALPLAYCCFTAALLQVGTKDRFHRSRFAKGPVRRFIDWCDWMLPEAWDVEHNYMHHYMLGEGRDPDLLERNAHHIREVCAAQE